MTKRIRSAPTGVLAILALLVPYIVGFTPSPEDSSWTTVSVAAGHGSYAHVSRDCSGNVVGIEEMPYRDAAVGVERVTPGLSYGVRGGTFHVNAERRDGRLLHPAQSSRYVNPYLGKDWKDGAFRVGVLLLGHESEGPAGTASLKWQETLLPTTELRLWGRPGFFFSTSFGSNMPLGSGGGVLDMGVGAMPEGGGTYWIGVALYTYEEGAVTAKLDIPLLTNLSLNPRFQVRGGDASEYGVALGLSARF